ncbi:MAG: hypothetical protein ABIG55_07000 [Candidatus Omnitrophota bacterium]
MKNNRTKDRIDAELSKTYFGNALRTIDLKDTLPTQVKKIIPPEKPKKSGKEPGSAGRMRSLMIGAVILAGRLRPLFLTVLVLAVLGTAAFYFMSHKRMIFNLNINVEPSDIPAQVPISEFVKNLSAKGIVPEPVMPSETARPALAEKILYDFENGDNGWEIPFWATEKPDHVALSLEPMPDISSSGKSSVAIYSEFLPGQWSAALIEAQHYLDLNSYSSISAKVYIPAEAPNRLHCEIILTVGDDWRFVEMARKVKLEPGKWVTVAADISDGSIDWKRTQVNGDFRKDIRKISLRIASNGTPYSGFIYVDEIKVSP